MKKQLVVSLTVLISTLSTQVAWAQKPTSHKARVGDIQDDEIERINRRVTSRKMTSFGFGPFGSSTSNEGGLMYGFSYGKNWETSENGEIRFDIQGAANSVTQHLGLGLGYGYMPSTDDFSPIFGAVFGVGYAGYKVGNESKSTGGFSGGAFTGIRMFRTADTQLELLATYNAVFSGHTPGVYGLQLRILY